VVAASNNLAGQVTAAALDWADQAFFLIGTNDTDSSDTFRSIYEGQVNALKTSNPVAAIYLLGVLPKTTEGNRATLNGMISTVATNTGATYINTDGWIDPATDTSDGIHPTATGHQKIADALWEAIT